MLEVHPSGFYVWLKRPHSSRHQSNQRQTGFIKQCWLESGGVYGYRKVHSDMRALGEVIGINRVYRLMHSSGLKAQVGYRKPRHYSGKPYLTSPNTLNRQFNPTYPDQSWVTDITYIRTHEGWLYLAVVMDLFSRRIVGWSMQSRITKELVLDALLMGVWRRKPTLKSWCIQIRAANIPARTGKCF